MFTRAHTGFLSVPVACNSDISLCGLHRHCHETCNHEQDKSRYCWRGCHWPYYGPRTCAARLFGNRNREERSGWRCVTRSCWHHLASAAVAGPYGGRSNTTGSRLFQPPSETASSVQFHGQINKTIIVLYQKNWNPATLQLQADGLLSWAAGVNLDAEMSAWTSPSSIDSPPPPFSSGALSSTRG